MRRRQRPAGEYARLSTEHDRAATPARSRKSTSSRRGSVSSAVSGDDRPRRSSRRSEADDGSEPETSRRRPSFAKRRAPAVAVESESSSDEEAPKKRGLLSSLFRGRRPSVQRQQSELSVASSRRSMDRRSIASDRSGRSNTAARLRGRRGSRTSVTAESDGSSDDVDGPTDYSGSSISTSSEISHTSSERSDESGGGRGVFLTPFGSMGAGAASADPFFGDTRIDMPLTSDGAEDGYASVGADQRVFESLGGPVTSSRQPIYIPDEDLELVLTGWGEKTWKRLAWILGCVCTLGALWLLGRWVPDWWLRGRGKTRPFLRAKCVVVRTQWGDQHIVPIERLEFPAPIDLDAIFPRTSRPPPTSREAPITPLPEPKPAINGSVPGSAAASIRSVKTDTRRTVTSLRYIDYRYYRLFLHPESGHFRMSRDWSDLRWTTAASLRMGVGEASRSVRTQLFGQNVISIQARSTFQILMDECLHPFCASGVHKMD